MKPGYLIREEFQVMTHFHADGLAVLLQINLSNRYLWIKAEEKLSILVCFERHACPWMTPHCDPIQMSENQ